VTVGPAGVQRRGGRMSCSGGLLVARPAVPQTHRML